MKRYNGANVARIAIPLLVLSRSLIAAPPDGADDSFAGDVLPKLERIEARHARVSVAWTERVFRPKGSISLEAPDLVPDPKAVLPAEDHRTTNRYSLLLDGDKYRQTHTESCWYFDEGEFRIDSGISVRDGGVTRKLGTSSGDPPGSPPRGEIRRGYRWDWQLNNNLPLALFLKPASTLREKCGPACRFRADGAAEFEGKRLPAFVGTGPKSLVRRIILDPENDWQVRMVELGHGDGRLWARGKSHYHKAGPATGRLKPWSVESFFREHDGVWRKYDGEVTDFALDPPRREGEFELRFEPGTLVYEEEPGKPEKNGVVAPDGSIRPR